MLRNSRRVGRLAWMLFLLAGAAFASAAGVTPDDPSPAELGQPVPRSELEAIAQLWKSYASDVSTAEVTYLSVTINCGEEGPEEGKLLAWLTSLDWSAQEDDQALVREIVTQLRPDWLLRDDATMQKWLASQAERKTLLVRGSDQRFVSSTLEHVRHRDLHLVADHANETVSAYPYNGCPIWVDSLGWWRQVPDAEMLNVSQALSRNPESVDFYYLNVPGPQASRVTVRREHGLPTLWRHFDVQNNALRRIDIFEDYTLFPGDTLFPRVRMEINFRGGKVTSLQLNLIRDARFNVDLADERFVLAAKPNWVWVDLRSDEQDRGRWSESTASVAAYFRNRVPEPAPASAGQAASPTRFGWRSMLLVVNGVVLVTVGIILWRQS